MRRWIRLSACLAASLVLVGCQKKAEAPPPAAPTTPPPPPFKVTGLELGRALTPDRRVATPTTTFGVKDTIYVVVATEGASKGTLLSARWTFQDSTLVSAESLKVTPSGPAYTEFHVSRPPQWKRGNYAVGIWADTAFVGSKSFAIH